jgi:DNA-binding HxlR family transcriptional regulator
MAKSLAITEQCPMEIGLNILSGKWKLKILWGISKGPVRFNELQRQLGKITTKTLTQQLKELEELGIILRTVYPDTPPRVTYSLTPLGQSIHPVLKSLCDWGTAYQATVMSQVSNK